MRLSCSHRVVHVEVVDGDRVDGAHPAAGREVVLARRPVVRVGRDPCHHRALRSGRGTSRVVRLERPRPRPGRRGELEAAAVVAEPARAGVPAPDPSKFS